MKALNKYIPLFTFFCIGIITLLTLTKHSKYLPYFYGILVLFTIINISKLITSSKENTKSKYIILFIALLMTVAMFFYFMYNK